MASVISGLTRGSRIALIFVGVCIAGVYVHEVGHAVAGWLQGIPVIATPAKEYVLSDQIQWQQKGWISLGGVAATTLLVLGTLVWYARERRPFADAALAGVLLPLCLYTLRFLVVGRGHDGLEWQEAQSALGLAPNSHAIDILFSALLLAGVFAWISRRRASIRMASLVGVAALALGGVVLLICLQVTNNILFDGRFPKTTTVNVPVGLREK